jgi:hypothetical protein
MQLEKKDAAKSKIDATKSKINPQKHFAPLHVNSQSGVHFQMRSRISIHMLNFEYEDNSKL